MPPNPNTSYIGRFAPSPSGPLHFGSLVCAVASFIDAKRYLGQWLVRIEDIDPQREQPGASAAILSCLEAHGLCWDGEVRYQSLRTDAYRATLSWLEQEELSYRCICTRKRLEPLNGVYDGQCRPLRIDSTKTSAVRLKVSDLPSAHAHVNNRIEFNDGARGHLSENLTESSGDFVIHRRDGFFAYQLAVVVDDIDQKISHVVRGDDLLETTAKQIYLYRLLDHAPPNYTHIPVILDKHGNKLSKQNHAPAINPAHASRNIVSALSRLNLFCDAKSSDTHLPSPQELLATAIANLT